MKSVLYYSANNSISKELGDQLQNIAYASGIDDFHSVDSLSALITTLRRKDVSILIVNLDDDDIAAFKKPQKILFLVDSWARTALDGDILGKFAVILKPFSQKSIVETLSVDIND